MNICRRLAAFVLAGLLAASTLRGQSSPLGPPACPAGSQGAVNAANQGRPSAESLRATAQRDVADPAVLTAVEPPNLDLARYRIEEYYQCTGANGCYWAEIDAQTRRADAELDRLLALHHAPTPDAAREQKLALVLDIDETSLSSYCEEFREDFAYLPAMHNQWIVSPEASIPIPGTVRLFEHARAAGVAVFFITGRPGKGTSGDQTAATARNLQAAGYHDWAGLMLHDISYNTSDTTTYKSAARASITALGYRILLNMGDQWSDLDGSPRAEISVKLPNPFYYLP